MTYGPWFEARFDGECDDCGAEFEAGDQIRSDGAGGWLGECCGEGDDD
jgi:hypothetical protein